MVGYILGGVVETVMGAPLILNPQLPLEPAWIHFRQGVLADDRHPHLFGHFRYAVVNLPVQMVRATRQDDPFPAGILLQPGQRLFSLRFQIAAIAVQFRIGGFDRFSKPFIADAFVGEYCPQICPQSLATMQREEGRCHDKILAKQGVHIATDHLRKGTDNGTAETEIRSIRRLFPGNTGEKNKTDTHFYQGHDMGVHNFGRKTDGFGTEVFQPFVKTEPS